MQRKILVALDGSIQDTYTRQYIKVVFQNQPDVLFTLSTILPSTNLEQTKQLLTGSEPEEPSDPKNKQKKTKTTKHHKAIIQNLCNHGFSADQFESLIIFSPTTPAQKLYSVGQIGLYDALLIARRGLDILTSLISGSTSKSILKKNHTMPVWLLNGQPENANFLIPVDCSTHCMSGIDHLAFILHDNPNATITLFHSSTLFPNKNNSSESIFYKRWAEEWQKETQSSDQQAHYHFFAAQMILKEAGFPIEKTTTLTSNLDIEPARAIIKHAKKNKFATIIMGRRPDTDKGIFKGVSDRVLANAKDTAMWIVG